MSLWQETDGPLLQVHGGHLSHEGFMIHFRGKGSERRSERPSRFCPFLKLILLLKIFKGPRSRLWG